MISFQPPSYRIFQLVGISRDYFNRNITHQFVDLPLERRAIRDAELYSAARHPLPECYPGTRTSFIKEIIEWTAGEIEEGGNLLWVYGPAGAGKTAIAQTIGQLTEEAGLFIAGFFFSRPRNHNDPSRFWPSICSQMVRGSGIFKDYISESFKFSDWSVLRKSLRSQFDELIKLPLSLHPFEGERIVVIDGLDECRGEAEQCEIIRCILDILQSPGNKRSGVRWLIISRPEPHLKRIFKLAESAKLCCTKEVPIDDLETRTDIQLYLKAEFTRISRTYLGVLGAEEWWPKQDDLERIFQAARGFFVYAATIVRFVGDPMYKDPVPRLQLVIDFIDGSLIPSASNPLAFVDNLYRELIERTPTGVLASTLRVLGTCIICPRLPLVHFAHLIGLKLEELYEALISLHSVINVPPEAKIAEEPLRFFHASFPDFLMNSERSGCFVQDVGHHRLQLAETCFRILGCSEVSYAEDMSQNPPSLDMDVDDGGDDGGDENEDEKIPSPLSMAYVILAFTFTHVWGICAKLRSPTPEFIRRTVGSLDFRRLQCACEFIPPQGFIGFLRWLDRSVRPIL